MTDISKQDMETLIKLQKAETQIVKLRAVLEKVAREKAAIAERLKKFSDALAQKKQVLETAVLACSDMENEIQVVDARIIRSNENLRMVKTNKEYQVLLREVDDNKKRKDALETQLLEYMDEKEKAQQDVDETQKEFDLLKEQVEAEQNETEAKSVDDREELAECLATQEEIGKNLDPFLMTRFAKISKMNNGSAVVPVINEVCMGCYMNIPPQLFIEVQRAKTMITCPQCSRILYFEKE